MGGYGSGGERLGSGRKTKDEALKDLEGSSKPGDRKRRSLPPIDEFDAPNDLTTDERNVWLRLAPGAFHARTLTRATEYAFILLCRNVLLEQQMRGDVLARGAANHRGLIQRVEAGLTAFGLRALGKPMVDDTPADDPLDEFDEKGTTH
jgi:hypothetical protein